MTTIHDNEIISYEMNVKEKRLILHTLNKTNNLYFDLLFNDVIIHSFKDEYFGSVILDIAQHSINKFISDYKDKWEFYLKEVFQLTDYFEEIDLLIKNKTFYYYTITASYGFYGFVIAKEMRIMIA